MYTTWLNLTRHRGRQYAEKNYPDTEDYLHRTAISQVLVLSVLALASAPKKIRNSRNVYRNPQNMEGG